MIDGPRSTTAAQEEDPRKTAVIEVSAESEFLRALYQEWTERIIADPEMDLATLRDLFDNWQVPTREPTDVTYREVDADGIPALWALPQGAATDRALLFFHGGGFSVGSIDSHRKLAAHLAKAAGVAGLIIDYRLAPEHVFPAAIEDGVTAFRWLLGQGFAPEHIFTAGDSAGGHLAVSVALSLRDEGLPLPGAIIPMSPWLDMKHEGPTMETNAATDALVSRALAQGMADRFLGDSGDPTHPLANPLHADLTGLPPLYVVAGGAETLLSDSERLVDRARTSGVDAELYVSPGMQHVFTSLAGRAPEADAAIAAAGAWVRPRLGLV
ncbi:alpha/beta hydrolase [Streptomyces flaveolus]|uniref:alpha/beta hydrolase n=1 Tax=Streptomyces flaveolus TaxID=67297 RepID=UPI00339F3DB1